MLGPRAYWKMETTVSDQAKEMAYRKAYEAAVLTLRENGEITAQAAVLALWENGAITASRAAEELEMSIHDFLDLLAAKGLSVVRGPLNLKGLEEAGRKLDRGR